MSSRHHIDDFMRGRIIGKIEEGRKITDVAREFDIAHSVVSRLWKSFKTTGMCSRRHGGGRVRRKQISRKTAARRLRGGGLYARRPVVCVPLTRQHRTAGLQWCREHHNWTEQDWACLLFSDESRFSLSSDCSRQLIWRESGTAFRPENIQEKDRYPTCSIMVWAGIMINGRTRLHVVANGTMTGQRYIDEVLLPHVRLFRGAVGISLVEGHLRITNRVFTKDLLQSHSEAFRKLALQITHSMDAVFLHSLQYYNETRVLSYREGSVIVRCHIHFSKPRMDATHHVGMAIIQALERHHGYLPGGLLQVDIRSLHFTGLPGSNDIVSDEEEFETSSNYDILLSNHNYRKSQS
ncbi:vitellogenin receptor [Trichonephila clavipes]|nr:vitellogenin receptor [Trichonephila clavipes]